MSQRQEDLLNGLKKANSYTHSAYRITVIETHISWILLTGKIAYKIKKPVKFGHVLDFSNLRLRKKFCQKEFTLNKQLCGRMYLGVVKIIKIDNTYKLVNLDKMGTSLEFAVKMREIPQKFRMDNLLVFNKINIAF